MSQRRRGDALRAYERAVQVAEAAGADRALSFAHGYAGHLYEQEKKFGEALRLTSQAVFFAQKIQSPDVLYQWEWQIGRILRAQGRRDDAIAAFQRAVDMLKSIRTDLSTRLGNSNARSSFREAAGGVFFDLADLLLQRADGLRDAELHACLLQARDTCEQLKSVELEDYFQDDCVNLLKKKRETIEDVLQAKRSTKERTPNDEALEKATRTTAVVYLIPLRDRTETLVSLPAGLRRVKARVTADQLTETVHAFREHLEKRTTSEYLAESWQLYDWLIRPLEPIFEQNKIDTLVFVPDGALRTIPMAALSDREHFLVEKYAIAITPGLTLMEPHPITRVGMTVMASGLSEAVQGYPALPFVTTEMNRLKELFNPDIIMNRDFAPERLVKDFAARPYSIVHIASHGEFSSDVKKTFVLTYASRFTLDALEQLIRPSQLRDQPVEMLALSACQTAAGDDRAALGLGGIAVKAGARSAFATLWCVNDQASTTLVGDFLHCFARPAADLESASPAAGADGPA
jgi:CHAT domain-containing protein